MVDRIFWKSAHAQDALDHLNKGKCVEVPINYLEKIMDFESKFKRFYPDLKWDIFGINDKTIKLIPKNYD